jgi:hypothetical protein
VTHRATHFADFVGRHRVRAVRLRRIPQNRVFDSEMAGRAAIHYVQFRPPDLANADSNSAHREVLPQLFLGQMVVPVLVTPPLPEVLAQRSRRVHSKQ